jgi:uncharacterized OB-fold protein/putative sterol carrier protein
MREYFGVKVEDIFNTMPERFRPEGAEGVTASYGYSIQGEGKWKLAVKDGRMKIEKVEDLSGCGTITITDGETFVGINIGKVDAMKAFTSGKFKVEGDFGALAKTAKMFRKYIPPKKEMSADVPPGEKAKEPEQELIVLRKTISVNQRFATGPVMGKFLKGLREKTILANRCPRCGRLQLPPREVCAVCRVRATDWVEVGPKGHLSVIEIVYYASPDPLTGETRETPYGSIHVLLDGCKGNETFWHLMRPDQIFQVKETWQEEKGTRLHPVWAEHRTGSIHDIKYFEIDE